MAMNISEIINHTVVAIRRNLPELTTAQLGPEYSYHSLPLCVIDSVFSIGVRYINAQKAVDAWCTAQRPTWRKFSDGVSPRKTIGELISIMDGHDSDSLAATFFGGNRQRTSTRSGILKAEAVVRFAKALEISEVDDFQNMRETKKAAIARTQVTKVTGQGTGISFDYLMMMAGDDSFVKADRMICRFVGQAAGLDTRVAPDQARAVIVGACNELVGEFPNLTPRLLDHLIWRHQRKIPCTV
jgi:hypothetical protein